MAEVYNQGQENNIVDRSLIPLPQPHLTGMKLQGDIALGDFLFNTIDEYGVVWVVTDIEGWWQHPEPEMPDIPRGLGDGSYDIKGRYNARVMTLNGVFLTPDPALVEASRDRLISATDLVYKGAWLKTGIASDNKRSSFVRLSGSPQIATVNARGRTEFSIGLKAADPIKYAWNDSDPDGYEVVEIPAANRITNATGVEILHNIGNVATPAELEIKGPITSPARIYNKTSDKLMFIVSGLRGRLTSSIVNKQLSFNEETLEDIATITTTASHGLLQGDIVEITGLGAPLDGEFEIISVPTETTFSFVVFPNVATIATVTTKKLLNTVATITTRSAHGFSTGNSILIKDVDAVFDGTYTITGTPTPTSFTYTKNRIPPRAVSGAILVSNIATLTTTEPHQFIEGEDVAISGININYNGSYKITSIPSTTTFSYALTRTNSKPVTNKAMTSDVATITMGSEHGFVPNENVTVVGVDDTFDGTYRIISTPTPTSFTYKIIRSTETKIDIRARFSNVATLSTATPHGLFLGESVAVFDVGNSYDGTYQITEVPSNTTLAYSNSASNETALAISVGSLIPVRRYVSAKQVIGGVATLFTAGAHGFLPGESVTVTSLGAPFNGTFTILSTPNTNQFTYAVSSPNVAYSVGGIGIINRNRAGTLVTITTDGAHPFSTGQYVIISGMDSNASVINGIYVITSTGANTFTYNTVASGVIEAAVTSSTNVTAVGGFAQVSRSIASTSDSGSANVGGSLPFAAVNGNAQVSPNILSASGGEIESPGVAVKKANIPFTPGITGATVDFGPDILEVNTLTRDVALNGSYDGARAKLDVLTDFFFIEPGDNEIEFVDEKDSASTALLKVFYRSGWLG
jgi:hypothetical protein